METSDNSINIHGKNSQQIEGDFLKIYVYSLKLTTSLMSKLFINVNYLTNVKFIF